MRLINWIRSWFASHPLPIFVSVEDELKGLIDNLEMMSETDSLWQPFFPTAKRSGRVDCGTMKRLTGLTVCEPANFEERLRHWIATQRQKRRYTELYVWMTENLKDCKVYKMETTPRRYQYFVVGIDPESNNLIGASAISVET